jgi:hypothetical protein
MVDQLAPDEPLSPELVLVFSPELRAQALARLGAPFRPVPRLRLAPAAAPVPVPEPVPRSFAQTLTTRAVQLAVIFVAVTILTVAMSLAAQALR